MRSACMDSMDQVQHRQASDVQLLKKFSTR